MAKTYHQPINLPEGITASVDSHVLNVKGKLGDLSLKIPSSVEILQDENSIAFKPEKGLSENSAITGTIRALTSNIIQGVDQGYEKKLEINGVGYRAATEGDILQLQLGYSHDIKVAIPKEITVKCAKPTEIIITGANKQIVGQFAAEIRSLRKPEPYKGKGVRYSDEYVRQKEGKKK